MSAWKVQKFFGDLLYDLRSRNLLPVVVMLIVGIVAVPILVSRGSSGNDSVGLGPTSASAVSSPLTENAAVAYHPSGLRNGKQRLNDLSPKNPFIQQFTGSPSTGSGSGTSLDQTTTTSGSTPGQTTSSGGSGGGGNNGGGGGSSGGGKTRPSTATTRPTSPSARPAARPSRLTT